MLGKVDYKPAMQGELLNFTKRAQGVPLSLHRSISLIIHSTIIEKDYLKFHLELENETTIWQAFPIRILHYISLELAEYGIECTIRK
jgi:hypothetical protein